MSVVRMARGSGLNWMDGLEEKCMDSAALEGLVLGLYACIGWVGGVA